MLCWISYLWARNPTVTTWPYLRHRNVTQRIVDMNGTFGERSSSVNFQFGQQFCHDVIRMRFALVLFPETGGCRRTGARCGPMTAAQGKENAPFVAHLSVPQTPRGSREFLLRY